MRAPWPGAARELDGTSSYPIETAACQLAFDVLHWVPAPGQRVTGADGIRHDAPPHEEIATDAGGNHLDRQRAGQRPGPGHEQPVAEPRARCAGDPRGVPHDPGRRDGGPSGRFPVGVRAGRPGHHDGRSGSHAGRPDARGPGRLRRRAPGRGRRFAGGNRSDVRPPQPRHGGAEPRPGAVPAGRPTAGEPDRHGARHLDDDRPRHDRRAARRPLRDEADVPGRGRPPATPARLRRPVHRPPQDQPFRQGGVGHRDPGHGFDGARTNPGGRHHGS